jgi:hypothetical protein
MKTYQIKVLGPQFGESVMFVEALSEIFRLIPKRSALVPPDEEETVVIPDYEGRRIAVSATVPALLHKKLSYQKHLQESDGIIYMLTASRQADYMNREDFPVFVSVLQEKYLHIPVVVLINDMWCGRNGELPSDSDILPYLVSGSPLLKTKIGTLGNNQPHCFIGLQEALRCIIDMIEKKRVSH